MRRILRLGRLKGFRSYLFKFTRRISDVSRMDHGVSLDKHELELKSLLLDASAYIGNLKDLKQPQLRFTGGWVRDKLLGTDSHDIDVGIDNMTGYDFGKLLQQYLATSEAKERYGPAALRSLGKIEKRPERSKHLETAATKILGLEVDLVNLRKETYAEDSRNPAMEFGTPEEDAMRRDATVNALFYNLNTSKVEDFTGRGLKDMKLKLIKTPLAPFETFRDDPLRVLRCIRFASRLGFEIAQEDQSSMADDRIKLALRQKISRERVGVEITKMMQGSSFQWASENFVLRQTLRAKSSHRVGVNRAPESLRHSLHRSC